MVFRCGETIMFDHREKVEMRVQIMCPNGFETSSLNFATSIREVVMELTTEALYLHWKHLLVYY